MSGKKRIIHVDIDAFYASVEENDFPELKGKAVAVGGRSEHSIITTANYKAREFGIRSAMPIFMAKNLCPNLIIQPVRMKRYVEKSREVFEILKNYSPKIEKVSIDEAYLDITHIKKNPIKTIYQMRDEIFNKTGLTISVGVSYNKFLAKIASDWKKPRGLMIIVEDEVPEILLDLDIKKVHGIGPKTQEKLRSIGINTVEDFLQLSEEFLCDQFGKWGRELYDRVRGIDHREVEVTRERKSLGIERTFNKSTRNREELLNYLENYSLELASDLEEKKIGANTITVKIKTEDFVTQTRGRTFDRIITDSDEIFKIAMLLFDDIKTSKKIRLLGVTASNLVNLKEKQLSFFEKK